MASKIVPLIPKHTVYVEPFCGSAAVMFAKPWPEVTSNNHYREVINDTNGQVVEFFRALRDNPDALVRELELTPYSRREYYERKLSPAASFFVDAVQSFGNKPRGGWGRDRLGYNSAATWANKLPLLLKCAERLQGVFVDDLDAIELIKRWDSPHTFFYCDPPYPGTDQGHYKGYTQEDFERLCDALDNIEGSFLLSCYANDAPRLHWRKHEFKSRMSAAKAINGERKNSERTEVVWGNSAQGKVRAEIQALYDSGKFDCFTGEI